MRLEDFKIKYINNTLNYFGTTRRAADFLCIAQKTLIKYTKNYNGPIDFDFVPSKSLTLAEDDYIESVFHIYNMSTCKVAKHIGMSHRFTYNKKIKIFGEKIKEETPRKLPKIVDTDNIPDVYLKIFPTNEERLRYLDNPSVRY